MTAQGTKVAPGSALTARLSTASGVRWLLFAINTVNYLDRLLAEGGGFAMMAWERA